MISVRVYNQPSLWPIQTSALYCDQVNDLFSLVVELKEEVERLRSIMGCEREIDWWSHTLPSLRPRSR